MRILMHNYGITVALKDNHETKNGTAVLSNGIFEDNLSKRYITEIKIFRWALLKIFEFKNFEFQYQKYLTTEKYFEDLRICKIEFLFVWLSLKIPFDKTAAPFFVSWLTFRATVICLEVLSPTINLKCGRIFDINASIVYLMILSCKVMS